jgi:uncharacterized coiled-coil DUF342 family protein
LTTEPQQRKGEIMGNTQDKLEASVKLYSEGNDLFDKANELWDEADRLAEESDKVSEEIDRVEGEEDDLREKQNSLYQKYNLSVDDGSDGGIFLKEAEEIDTKMFQLSSDATKQRRHGREINLKHSKLNAEARAICANGSKLHNDSRKLFLEGMTEWKNSFSQVN